MAACGSLQHIFEKPLPETPSLLESLSSWNQIDPVKPIEQSSFTELFAELRFTADSFFDLISQTSSDNSENECESKKSLSPRSFSSSSKKNNYESLQLCTEGLGFESFDDVEDLKNDINEDKQQQDEQVCITRHYIPENHSRRTKSSGKAFPPPISCIGKSGKPSVSFKSYRQDGRFVLKQVPIPSQEFLHAHREDGRLQLHFVRPSDEILEEEDEEEEEDDVESIKQEYEQEESEETNCNNDRNEDEEQHIASP